MLLYDLSIAELLIFCRRKAEWLLCFAGAIDAWCLVQAWLGVFGASRVGGITG